MSSIKLKHSGGNSVSLNPPTSAPTSSEVAFKLPNEDGSAGQVLKTDGSGNLSWVTPGITQADQWRVTANYNMSSTETTLTSNWERNDTMFSYIGSGMTESSGIFTFPQTGVYKVNFQMTAFVNGQQTRYLGFHIKGSQDGTNYSKLTESLASISDDGSAYQSVRGEAFFDVTNTTNCKIKFDVSSEHNNITGDGHSDQNRTFATFIRLGDT